MTRTPSDNTSPTSDSDAPKGLFSYLNLLALSAALSSYQAAATARRGGLAPPSIPTASRRTRAGGQPLGTHAYMIGSSKPPTRRACLGTTCGSKLPGPILRHSDAHWPRSLVPSRRVPLADIRRTLTGRGHPCRRRGGRPARFPISIPAPSLGSRSAARPARPVAPPLERARCTNCSGRACATCCRTSPTSAHRRAALTSAGSSCWSCCSSVVAVIVT